MTTLDEPKFRILPAEIGVDRFAGALGSGWDWPVAGCSTLADYVELAIVAPNRRFFWLLGDDQPLGFFGFAHNAAMRRFEIGTYLAPAARATGANSVVKHSSIAASQTMRLPLAALVRDENARSLAAMRRISGSPGDLEMVAPNALRWVFELHSVPSDSTNTSLRVRRQLLGYASEFHAIASRSGQSAPLPA